jgi:hypothetical protein
LRLKRKEAESDESHAAAAAFLADFCSTVAPQGVLKPLYFQHLTSGFSICIQVYPAMDRRHEILAIIASPCSKNREHDKVFSVPWLNLHLPLQIFFVFIGVETHKYTRAPVVSCKYKSDCLALVFTNW